MAEDDRRPHKRLYSGSVKRVPPLSPTRLCSIACMLVVLIGAPALVRAESSSEATIHAKVVAYTSATAFAVLDPGEKLKRVKLTGVDAPERRQRFAAQAKQLASEWLGAKPIVIAVDAIDKEQRIHGRVTVDGRDVGLTLIEAGLAWCDPGDEASLPPPLRIAYRQACNEARKQRRGLWQDAHPTPPWEYRKIPEFDPLPNSKRASEKNCRDIGHQTVQCDDGTTYRGVGGQIVGSDGTIYSRRGNTVTGSDGNRFEQQGNTVYGTDGSVCRSRGRRVDCY